MSKGLTPEKEGWPEEEREDERRDEACRVPPIDGSLSERQDEADQSARHEKDSDYVETLPAGHGALFGSGVVGH